MPLLSVEDKQKKGTIFVGNLFQKHKIKNAFLFGSVLSNHFDDQSDIDLLISFKPMDYGDYVDTYFDLAEKFENLFKSLGAEEVEKQYGV
jgi:predicted nucleotidyltransferase